MLPGSEALDFVLEPNVMVAMRDAVRLATDVYRPARSGRALDGRFPVIMERTPYGKQQDSRSEIDAGVQHRLGRAEVARHFVKHGYVVVYQDCRGCYESEGEFVKYLSEAEDGEDTMHWLVRQAWCDGRVATMGFSYAAHTQMALACLAPPGLAAMVVDSGGFSNAYQGGIRQGGAFELKQVIWAFRRAKQALRETDMESWLALEREDLREWFKMMPWHPGQSPLRWAPEYEDYLFEQWRQGSFNDYWRQSGIYAAESYDHMPDIPQVHVSSWYDVYVRTATENYMALIRRKHGPIVLIMGPWLHGDRNVTHAGDVEFGAAAAFDGSIAPNWRVFRLRWFDRWIRQVHNGIDEEPAVRLFLMGGGSGRKNAEGRLDHGGRWIAGTDWPLPGTHFVDYFLHPTHRLELEAPADPHGSCSYDFDPHHPVPTIGGALTSGQPVFEGGAFDQREDERFFGARGDGLPLAVRPDVLVYQTDPLAEDSAVIGPVSVQLFVSSDCLDTDFTAKLIDVYPPSADFPQGFAMNLTDGILRCRYRNSWEHPELMADGEVYAITIECFATANLFKAGHRIRLDISSSNFPKYDVNSNTGEPEGAARRKRVAANTVHLNGQHPSHLVLPIVPTSALSPLA